MCGILGAVNATINATVLDQIKHRGPDASGAKSFEINQNSVHLLHRRLSIVDVSEAGSQPMFADDRKACITFNGEIYNHLDLKEKLPNITFNGHSDTETIVNYFRTFGIYNTLKDLNGIFAFAYLDVENEFLYLARDRFGVKPLYYYFHNNQLLFSSEIRPLRAFLNPAIDKGSLMSSLRMRYTPSPSTIYTNIYKVEPGQLLVFNLKGNLSLIKSYFVATPKSLGTKKGDYRNLVKEYGNLFEKAVERQLMADVEVGILLSGGVDSALVAAIAKQRSKTGIKAFTVGFEGEHDNIDEIEYAKQTAAIIGLEHYTKKINSLRFLDSVEAIAKIVEEPIGTTSIIPMYFLSELAASKVKVVLSGQGADEPLGGYNKYKGLPLLEKSRLFLPLLPLTKSVRFIYNRNERFRRLISSMQYADDVSSLVEFNAISSVSEVTNLMTAASRKVYRNALLRQQNAFKQIWKERTPEQASTSNLFLYYDLRTSLADDLLMYTDKISMHFSLECRVPILDNDLIDFIESLKSGYKFNSKRGKIIHKDFAKEYLPTTITERKKLNFKSPTEAWFRQQKNDIEKVFTSDKAFSTLFDMNAVMKLLSNHQNGRNLEKQIFLLLSIYYILKQNTEL
ncbi:asparagine synthase (glutamine-hydrolyzing) [Ilyomonas limi]|uniref:asparagine synthase (glutamine-hydrolyzing) n=1 Tax=Ilyomonas limi TaxID=2575867 RepID=A0A4U3L5R2_9BACT|nr:asparagine synthase (glutamine-hydrolyzing) [Ilyomonas limi]TKK70340.1 asparagine synthase (glutamine-hydrolyzing) [Ilyomonas limi]